MYKKYENELNILKSHSLTRELSDIQKQGKFIIKDGKKFLNLSSNDYLGIAEDYNIINTFLKDCDYSFGSASARLLTGTSPVYSKLESYISKMYSKEDCLLFNSGYHANIGTVSSFLQKNDAIFLDKLDHASIIDGMKLSGADFYRYKHLNYDDLEVLLAKHRHKYENAIIFTESLFSMDGDIADLNKLIELKKKYNALLFVDEAHAFGVYGNSALGICELQKCIQDIDLIIATFGKAIGSVGAFACGKSTLIDYLKNKARSFIFSTSLPEVNIAYSLYILEHVLPNSLPLREALIENSRYFRQTLSNLAIETPSSSYIVPIIVGESDMTIKICDAIKDSGYYVLPIRYPTVAKNKARIRFSLRADITKLEIDDVISILQKQPMIKVHAKLNK